MDILIIFENVHSISDLSTMVDSPDISPRISWVDAAQKVRRGTGQAAEPVITRLRVFSHQKTIEN